MQILSRCIRLIMTNIKGKDLVERRHLMIWKREISEKMGECGDRRLGSRGSGMCAPWKE